MKLTPVPDPIPGKAYIIVHARTPRVVRLMARASDGSLFYESLPGDNMTLQARCEEYAAYELELPAPVVKLFTPDSGATWLLTEIDPDDHDHAFGLCDLGLGMPEIGWVSLGELATVRGGLGLPIERDLSFRAEKRLSAYARDARLAGRIVV